MTLASCSDLLKRMRHQHSHIQHLASQLKLKALDLEYPYIFALGEELQRELREHFLEEEKVMQKFGFTYYEVHKREHAKLSSSLMRIVLSAEDHVASVPTLIDSLVLQLQYHIEVHDVAYVTDLTKRLIGEAP